MRMRKAAVGWLVMKVDLEKAYDKVAWSFIEDTLLDIGFNKSWRRNIMNCITTSRLAVNWETIPLIGSIRREESDRETPSHPTFRIVYRKI